MKDPGPRSLVSRLLISLSAGFGAAVLVAIGVAVAGIYLTGHGHPPLNRPLVDWAAAGVHLGRGDVPLLSAAALAAGITWRCTTWGAA
jgi:hypothetical protein